MSNRKLKLDTETGELHPIADTPPSVFWKTPWNHDTNMESERTGLTCADPSLTKQEFVEEADINVILNRFMRTGEPPPMALPEHFIDMTHRPTYFEIQERLATASAMFYELPPKLRAEYQNEPAQWADAVSLAAARDDLEGLRALGIDAREKPQEPPKGTPPVPELQPAPAAPKAAPASDKGGDAPKPPSDKEKN